jgi:hypothetical protein
MKNGDNMISKMKWSSKQFTAIAALSPLLFALTACGLISEAKLEIPVKPAHAQLVNPCAVKALDEMGFAPRITAGPSPEAIRISASQHPTVIASTPALIIDVATEGGTKPVQVTVKGVAGPIPVSASMLDNKTEEFVSLFNACMN